MVGSTNVLSAVGQERFSIANGYSEAFKWENGVESNLQETPNAKHTPSSAAPAHHQFANRSDRVSESENRQHIDFTSHLANNANPAATSLGGQPKSTVYRNVAPCQAMNGIKNPRKTLDFNNPSFLDISLHPC